MMLFTPQNNNVLGQDSDRTIRPCHSHVGEKPNHTTIRVQHFNRVLFKYSPKGCKTQFVTAGRLVTVLDMRPSTTNTITTNRATKFTAHCKLTLLWILHESELPRHLGKRAQTLTAPTTQTSPDDQCHNYRRVAQ